MRVLRRALSRTQRFLVLGAEAAAAVPRAEHRRRDVLLGEPAGDVVHRGGDGQAAGCPGGGRIRVGLLAEHPDQAQAGQVAGQRFRAQPGAGRVPGLSPRHLHSGAGAPVGDPHDGLQVGQDERAVPVAQAQRGARPGPVAAQRNWSRSTVSSAAGWPSSGGMSARSRRARRPRSLFSAAASVTARSAGSRTWTRSLPWWASTRYRARSASGALAEQAAQRPVDEEQGGEFVPEPDAAVEPQPPVAAGLRPRTPGCDRGPFPPGPPGRTARPARSDAPCRHRAGRRRSRRTARPRPASAGHSARKSAAAWCAHVVAVLVKADPVPLLHAGRVGGVAVLRAGPRAPPWCRVTGSRAPAGARPDRTR